MKNLKERKVPPLIRYNSTMLREAKLWSKN